MQPKSKDMLFSSLVIEMTLLENHPETYLAVSEKLSQKNFVPSPVSYIENFILAIKEVCGSAFDKVISQIKQALAKYGKTITLQKTTILGL
ncbi:MAG: hypothetical protein GWN01_00220, partial [Nitrosopumilaceae archaeon]|nr:hypothetical protein [Nitrosopumilaceae archaeon]NIT99409.1 hypothetical protein [Nitrosopumilaceae archaeon]NIU86147.1 hypothetical protein [Nitrosopumilaceae archaeon]NIV64943.1 hypothetical protein [Nitrosopumilaceae archaeon]NIX60012.1 hypothetical protein [Nitrosopumilaceae archaeon]